VSWVSLAQILRGVELTNSRHFRSAADFDQSFSIQSTNNIYQSTVSPSFSLPYGTLRSFRLINYSTI
jgi:hypothetical protein